MKKITLPQDEINRHLDRIKENPKLNAVFEKLTDLYGLPKWLNEINPLQSPDRIISEWEELFNKYAEIDIMDAVNRLFKFRKSITFPTAAHIIAELPDDVQEVKKTENKSNYCRPAELIPSWDKALVFAAVVNMFGSRNAEIMAKAREIIDKMSVKCLAWANQRTKRAMMSYLANDPRIDDLYDDPTEKFVYCFKAGVFDKIREKIKQNLSGQFEPKDITEEA